MTQKLLKTMVILLSTMAIPALAQTPSPPQTLEGQGGAGDLLVAPTRVVLEGRSRAAEIVLSNRAKKEATYRIGFIHLRMKEDGSYEELNEETAKSSMHIADDLVRFSPRQVTLRPGESQVVKVLLRKPEALPDGEYISHLMFRAVPDLATGEDVEAQPTMNDQISIKLIPVYGVSIPVIVRSGTTSGGAEIAAAQRSGNNVVVAISRTGNRSAYGDVVVMHGSEVVGQMRGVSVLSYLNRRQLAVALSNSGAGPLTIEFRTRVEEGATTLSKVQIP